MAILRVPALIDPHFHLSTVPESQWSAIFQTAYRAGYDALQIMPDLKRVVTSVAQLNRLAKLSFSTPLHLHWTAAATGDNVERLQPLREASALKVWLGMGPENVIVEQEELLRRIILSTEKLVMIHLEDEATLLRNYQSGQPELSMSDHGRLFDQRSATRALIKALTAAKTSQRRIYLCHLSTKSDIELVRAAKREGIRVIAEVAPHHLFLNELAVERLGVLAKVNPPLRSSADQEALWQAIADGTIDTIGSDSYCWQRQDKIDDYSSVPPGLPNYELTLPLLLTAVKQGRLTLARFIELTSTNPARVFQLPPPKRSLFVDMDTWRPIATRRANWQPYAERQLVGWPVAIR